MPQWHPGSAGAQRLLDDFVRGGRLRAFDKERAKVGWGQGRQEQRCCGEVQGGQCRTQSSAGTQPGCELAGAAARAPPDPSGSIMPPALARRQVDRASTSRLSPHIHYGELSARAVYAAAKAAEAEWARAGSGGASTSVADFLRQLGYRE